MPQRLIWNVSKLFINRYVEARNALLEELQLKGKSNRDPLSEFSEWLVAVLVKGNSAENRVQKGWDV